MTNNHGYAGYLPTEASQRLQPCTEGQAHVQRLLHRRSALRYRFLSFDALLFTQLQLECALRRHFAANLLDFDRAIYLQNDEHS
jgi:hypothetical protein